MYVVILFVKKKNFDSHAIWQHEALISFDNLKVSWYTDKSMNIYMEVYTMTHIKTIKTRNLCQSAAKGGCGECQTSCQSACKTSCGLANQKCEKLAKDKKESK